MSDLTTEQFDRIRDFVAALRSGEYRQTIQQLGRVCDDGKFYCCEGVAVERYAAQLDGWKSAWDGNDLVLIDADGADGSDYAEDAFWEAMALSTGPDNGTATVFAFVLPKGQNVRDTGAGSVSFMGLNDDGLTFSQIADLIEWQYLSNTEVTA